ncbi:Similar to part of downy mildew resistance protein RPP5 [Arabidopsis thaliana]|uniref:Disease resistance protein (TIR-NBS class) n=1 Tax=Arabidopsis thaliana TaxID=3702 RepID=Q9SSP1_ARATH|nr:Disease resistance protein (TIR-NBS class) [Arabidopsis thaliana]AAD55632.1 Similar to part of downy mildew resistance protein RPP5 [Arabidopsis thaliana]AEE35382.1 Disease resistance protein (TIR-NBS class) [Arabidopsis thaliana]|eukprot:NP_177428.1 Disease resistance protein (TIR-NBS class) [Arabidopsis thaliana]
MSSSSKFEVFLSFCSEDPSKTFVSVLDRWLEQKDITTNFKDDSFLAEESKLAVVVVSESYPISVLCLNQLEKIVNSHSEGRLSILPIFYGVDPYNVRKQTGYLAEPFQELGEGYPDDKIQEWRVSLTKLTNIPALDSRYWSNEADMIELIANEILSISNRKPLTAKGDGLVGMDRQMQTLYKLLDFKAAEEVRLIGIWGPGGIGKTTLARYAYEEISSNFKVHVFVDKAEKICHQDRDLLKLLTEKGTTQGLDVGIDKIKSTFGHRKGLIVIDCVDNIKQLKEIVYLAHWFIPGSRVIFVTQDRNLLVESGVEHAYEVQSLRYDEALQLFSHSAFDQQHPPTSFESLSLRAVHISGFLPLTLKILGSSLRGKDEERWEKELQQLEGDQEKAIMEITSKRYTRAGKKEEDKEKITSFILLSDD